MTKTSNVPPEVREACETLVSYLAKDERKHFEEAGCPGNHIWRDLVCLDNWLTDGSEVAT